MNDTNPMVVLLKFGVVILLAGFAYHYFFGIPRNLPEMLKSGALVIDVRNPLEFAGGHADGAINIPDYDIGRKIEEAVPDKNQAIVVYCKRGSRSATAKSVLERMGYTQVVNGRNQRTVRRALR